ncbi:hypothetical protein EYF80_003405 [Liparis tanakae]|uniref:Uncharacterized protein n=1 Tax=Liparis tanakae TaxID=230148 RepID=A0A4Z2J8A9_9TELE|nr:hypothetical protein EYF80_003405 [Liparis tanakae]
MLHSCSPRAAQDKRPKILPTHSNQMYLLDLTDRVYDMFGIYNPLQKPEWRRREVGQVSSIEVQQVRNGSQVLARLLSEILSHRLVGLAGVGDGSVQARRVALLVHLERLPKEGEGLSDFLVLLLKPRHLLASELADGGVHDHDVLVHPLGEGLEAFDLALYFLEVQRDSGRAADNNDKSPPF